MVFVGALLRRAPRRMQCRGMATKIVSSQPITLEEKNDALEVLLQRGPDTKALTIPLVWLRDHCRHPASYNQATNQRKSNATNLFECAEIVGKESVSVTDENKLAIRWKDGLQSQFHVSDIVECSELDPPPVLSNYVKSWKQLAPDELPRIHISGFSMKTLAGLFVKYGMVIVDGVEANPHATEQFCRSIAPIHNTFFGSFWVFSNKTQEKGEEYHEDTAYGNESIGPHTDGTYFQQTPGIQVFHCLHVAERGGDTLLVDGLYCANQLKKQNPEAFRILTEHKVSYFPILLIFKLQTFRYRSYRILWFLTGFEQEM
uniref:trimethyllysine dioxygenase n=1 Tax=Angiostrongylus cantonensis TaxID=6313 RepID=A0A0K0CYW4_ANGCA